MAVAVSRKRPAGVPISGPQKVTALHHDLSRPPYSGSLTEEAQYEVHDGAHEIARVLHTSIGNRLTNPKHIDLATTLALSAHTRRYLVTESLLYTRHGHPTPYQL